MKESIVSRFSAFVLLMISISGCASASAPIPPTFTPSAIPPTSTPSPIPPTLTPEPTATAKVTPSPTPLPGSVVYPVDSLGTSIPWLRLDRSRWPSIFIVTINNQIPPFNNPLVRQAFAASIDRDIIVEMAEKWYAIDPTPATTFIPPLTLGRDLYGEVGINFDPTRAKDLLTQAGYTDTSSFPKVTFIVNSYGEIAPGARFNMANSMANMWHTYLGVAIEVQVMQPPGFGERLKSNPPELFWNGWLPDPGNDPDHIITIFRSDSEFNYGQFSNPDFDSLIDRAALSHDPAERQVLYIQAERLLCETEAAVIPLYHTFSNLQ
jgi:ABC-type transport system substrate-binding protein